ncbi:unnamed protein product, partial [Mesorhabditis belari]|uniref:Metalloendopeptidase n=1 Tax=Mesorhabditis belari TaxID=2138241 RepID=A0AAF3EA49_9BILA
MIAQNNMFFDKSLPDVETSLNDQDFMLARISRDAADGEFWASKSRVNDSAMYNKDRFEGDIINSGLNPRTVSAFMGQARMPGVMRNAVRQTYLKWTDGRIPYTISSQYSSFSRSKIAEAIEEYRKLTCIDFAPKSAADQDYIHIVPDDGCYSLVGRIGGKQPVSLGDGCIQKGIIIHELMHAVGFFHEQSRADRDDYVTINWSNVESGLQDQFDKYSLNMIDHLGTKYDYGSVMHYAPTAFSKNGKSTIEPKESGVEIGQRIGFSEIDVFKINKLYDCPQLSTTTEAIPSSTLRMRTKKPSLTKENLGIMGPIGGSSAISSGTSGTGSQGMVPRPSIIPHKPEESGCRDRRRDCQYLAAAGHCENRLSIRFMTENCQKSCGKCPKEETGNEETSVEACSDSRSWCSRWATSGMCQQPIFEDYMRSKCRKSCNLC